MDRIDINWQGPISFEESKELNGPTDFGLYQFYGNHLVYGQRVLLYIGRAKDIKFGARMRQYSLTDWTGSSALVHVGRLCGKSQQVNNARWSQLIEIAEKILIFIHAPSWNSANLNGFGEIEDIHIFNWGNRGQLLPEATSTRWRENNCMPEEFKTFEI